MVEARIQNQQNRFGKAIKIMTTSVGRKGEKVRTLVKLDWGFGGEATNDLKTKTILNPFKSPPFQSKQRKQAN
jgi:hypothetical protein